MDPGYRRNLAGPSGVRKATHVGRMSNRTLRGTRENEKRQDSEHRIRKVVASESELPCSIKARTFVLVPFNPPSPLPYPPPHWMYALPSLSLFQSQPPLRKGSPITFTHSATPADGGWQPRSEPNVSHRRPPALTPKRTPPSNTLHLLTRRNHHRHRPLTEQYCLATIVRAPVVSVQRY